VTEAHAPTEVVVVGGGIVGRSVALFAAQAGVQVTVVEAHGATFGTSSANAGHLVPSHRVPFAAPGMVKAGLHSLLTRDGAFAISPRVMWRITPWLWRFARHSTEANVARGVPVLAALLDTTFQEVQRLRADGAALDFADGGIVQVCTGPRSLAGLLHEADEWARWGVRTERWSAADLAAAEPTLRTSTAGAVLLADDARCDPAALLAAITARGDALGVRTLTGTVQRIEHVAQGDVRVHTSEGLVPAEQVVVAAGSWTPALCAGLGLRLPIVAARGNSITLPPDVATAPRRPLLLVDQRLAVSPLSSGLRITGGFALTSSKDRAVSARRSQQLVRRAAEVLDMPATATPTRPWTGLRPATPDGLPMIGRLPHAPSVLVAAGHGMLGSSTGLGTGVAVAALLTGAPAIIDEAVVSPARFARGRTKGTSAR
jgi:D-amino-acid dehydrogenase